MSATEEKLKQLRDDVAELESLEKIATRPRIRDFLQIQRKKLETEIISLKTEPIQISSPAAAAAVTPAGSQTYTVKISNYGWDQSEKFVKVYVTLNGVGRIPSTNVTCDFSASSFHLLVKDLEGKNYEMVIKDLLEDINPTDSHFKVKTDMVVVFLKKSQVSHTWSVLTKVEKKLKDEKDLRVKQPRNTDDPSASLMTLMKDMYDQGDDEMKRTIAKAWVESQEKQRKGQDAFSTTME
ncbi:unnamed protein product [Cyprideis torosa]|uniref:Calcyclin-binding protein n=1 Tax=Cyprideis torosa TaxID=163714 RepID=A0A7R8W3H0_9CRUS|nr:unnamed protein product [Cyprideis torosa]CAG0882861.1 unnamed protein product [Cyprideis torosa]